MSRWWTLAFSRKIRGNSRSFGVGGKLAADYEAGDVVLDNAYNIHCSAVNETEWFAWRLIWDSSRQGSRMIRGGWRLGR
jgi:hypothetical protein